MASTKGLVSRAALLVFGVAALLLSCTSNQRPSSTEEQVVYQEDFEQSAGGWRARGSESVAVSTDYAHSGVQALAVTARTATWNGPIHEITNLVRPGAIYRVGVWVMVPEGPDTSTINVSTQRVESGREQYANVGGGVLTRGEWGYIEADFTVPASEYVIPISIYFETPYKPDNQTGSSDLVSFYIDDVVITRLPPQVAPGAEANVPDLYGEFPGLRIGAAIHTTYLEPTDPHNGLLRHFNSFVFGNEMKMDATQPIEGRFNFTAGDRLVRYVEALDRDATIRGHTLLWHMQFPRWFFSDDGDAGETVSREVLLQRIEDHITAVVSHYRSQVDYWDVVNEVIGDDGALRDSQYLQIVGSDEYIRRAFQAARAADPDALLFINDYNISRSGAKQDALYNLVRDLRADGVPIDGVGIQAHISISDPPLIEIASAIDRFASLGVQVHVTELDVSIYGSSTEAPRDADAEILERQAARYRGLFQVFRRQAEEGNLQLVTFWGIADDDTWLDNRGVPGREDHPLLFGKDLRPKPAFWALVELE